MFVETNAVWMLRIRVTLSCWREAVSRAKKKNALCRGKQRALGLRLSMILFLLLVDRSSRGLLVNFLLFCCYFCFVVDKYFADGVPKEPNLI